MPGAGETVPNNPRVGVRPGLNLSGQNGQSGFYSMGQEPFPEKWEVRFGSPKPSLFSNRTGIPEDGPLNPMDEKTKHGLCQRNRPMEGETPGFAGSIQIGRLHWQSAFVLRRRP
jgi:hypothetical protein